MLHSKEYPPKAQAIRRFDKCFKHKSNMHPKQAKSTEKKINTKERR